MWHKKNISIIAYLQKCVLYIQQPDSAFLRYFISFIALFIGILPDGFCVLFCSGLVGIKSRFMKITNNSKK